MLMDRRTALPPLAAIRVFEAAARLGSFTRAGEELAMTQAAVSYQVKLLEERLGLLLFVRQPRQVTLTSSGRRLSAAATEAFDTLRNAFAAVRADTTAGADAVIIDAMDPQVMVQLSDQPGLREVADEAAAKLQAAIDSLQSADAR